MKKYYLHSGTEQLGPFDINDLKAKGINKDTPIWYDGLPDWTTADKVDELKDMLKTATPPPFGLKQIPPPIIKPEAKHTTSPKKKSNTLGIILQSIGGIGAIAIIAFMIITYINNRSAGSGTTLDSQTYQEKVLTIEEMEKADPAKFLDATGTYNPNFWGDAMKVHGTVKNNATVANYKDVVVEVTFYSETDTELDRKQYTIYDFFPAHSTKTFELKISKPSACKKLGWDAISATPY